MATTAGGLPYVESSDLISGYPTVSQALAEELDDQLAAKAALAGATYTGTHDFSGATVNGITSGLAPIAPTSIANSGGTASTSGYTTTFTGVSSISLNGVFSAAYTHYRILMSGQASGNQWVFARLRAAGTDQTGANYNIQRLIANGTGASASAGSAATELQIGDWDSATLGILDMTLWDPFGSGKTAISARTNRTTNTARIYMTEGGYNAAYSADGLTLYCTGYTVTGTISVYGYKA